MDTLNAETKSFSWSFSRLKAFEDCPRRYHETMAKKDAWPEAKSPMLEWGDAVHVAMANSLRNGVPLPTKFRVYQHWIDKVMDANGEMLVEEDCQWAITRELQPTPWFAPDVWMRVKADVIKLDLELDKEAAWVIDWKTGKSLNGDPVQLLMTSLMLFCHFPQLKGVRSDFIWLQENSNTMQSVWWHEVAEHWRHLLPRVARLECATSDQHFPPVPGRFCRNWCPVRSCEYHGR